MMSHDAFLLRQLSELTEALRRRPVRDKTPAPPRPGKLWTDEYRARLLRDILAHRTAGRSFGSIAHALNERGERGEFGSRWYGSTVRNFILRTQAQAR